MEFLRFLLAISWKHITIAIVAGLVSGVGNALLISLINREVHEGHAVNALQYFSILAIFIIVTSMISQFMLIFLSQNAIYELRVKLSKNILSSPLEHLERLKENRLLVSFTDDVHTLTHAVASVPSICVDFATVVGCFVYFAWLSNALFILTIASTVSAIWFVQTILNKAERLFFKSREEEDTLFKHFQALMSGIKELKLNQSKRQAFMERELQSSAVQLRQLNTKAMKRFAIANGFGQLSQFLSLGFILFILPLFLNIPLTMLAAYVLIGTFIALPMQNLLNRIPELVRGNIALRKIERMKLSLSSLSEADTLVLSISPSCQLQFQAVTYLYHPELPPFPPEGFPEGHPPFPPEGLSQGFAHSLPPLAPESPSSERKLIPFPSHPPYSQKGNPPPPPRADEKGFLLGPISFSWQPGELIFIIGGNGSGKSTLAKLITGLYPPLSGAIYLNGKRITQDNVEWYRQHFSAIFYDFYLFDSFLGCDRPNLDQEVENYLMQLQLAHKVTVKNGVLSTTELSQGQRKRLALLTAYLEDRPIYVFDEWAADQEPRFRELFYKQILLQLKERGKIVIVISHDERYFHLADHIIKLDYGAVESEQTVQPSGSL
ncbi:ATP-binding cassette domain-containing protein [Microcystis aeruginosa LEGE 11464]|jgi:putative ATP-binding cassette transporter|uniref:ATP-binding cassette domain-containing protein n=1 Tax=Microcystis aeruginosa TaxID=1126 RepID=UPI001882173F|nr:ATP-binding cassette domain-containing protein [Microcystis aeruginosa]MBE9088648.1 ATP-binding cassette domain-containing protein [Microcystis aeruginosa LEGE 11464]MCZ8127502.1 ATP-binding cassette domain-containing protein [Microcystis sp. LE19-114.1B]